MNLTWMNKWVILVSLVREDRFLKKWKLFYQALSDENSVVLEKKQEVFYLIKEETSFEYSIMTRVR